MPIVGAAIVSHVPPMVMPLEQRMELNDGADTTLVAGIKAMRSECLDGLGAETIIVFDTHWFTTVEHLITSHAHRSGLYTSEELPRGMSQMPYDFPGDPELAQAVAARADDRDDTWITAIDDPYLPIHYPTVNLMTYLQRDERWVSTGICQTAEPDDFLLFGELLARAIDQLGRRVVLLASGGLSHRFWPLKQFRDHESADLSNIRSQEARRADEQVIAWLKAGDHASVLEYVPEYAQFAPEGFFGHYLTMVGALGGSGCAARARQYGDYEAVAGTGQVHLWFETA